MAQRTKSSSRVDRKPRHTKHRTPHKKVALKQQDTAYHEAGHAVAILARGLSVELVTIIPGEGFNGVCYHPSVYGYYTASKTVQRQIARDIIVVCYAGLPAARLLDPKASESGARQDEIDAFNLSREFQVFPKRISCVDDDNHNAYLNKLKKEAERLVKRNQRAIGALAEELLKKKTMNQQQAEKVVGPLLCRLDRSP